MQDRRVDSLRIRLILMTMDSGRDIVVVLKRKVPNPTHMVWKFEYVCYNVPVFSAQVLIGIPCSHG